MSTLLSFGGRTYSRSPAAWIRNCADIPYRNFRVLWNVPDPDPHHFDGDRDGIGCES